MPKTKRSANHNVQINVDYLKKVVKSTGLTQPDFSVKLGQPESFISNAIYRKFMRRSTAELMCDMFDADFGKLTDVSEPKKAAKKVMMADDKSVEALANCMIRIEKKLDTILEALT